jgi:hypothetical protein
VAYECRRIVTGHTPEGKSTVLYDSSMPLLEADSAAGARQEDRAGAASAVIWTTQGPVDNDDPSDTALRKVGPLDDVQGALADLLSAITAYLTARHLPPAGANPTGGRNG